MYESVTEIGENSSCHDDQILFIYSWATLLVQTELVTERGHGDHLKILYVFVLFGHHFIIANIMSREA